jgi:hypothetical protein
LRDLITVALALGLPFLFTIGQRRWSAIKVRYRERR